MKDSPNLAEFVALQEKILEEITSLKYGTSGKSATTGDKVADFIVSFMGSWRFIIIQSIILCIWLASNAFWLVNSMRFDPYPFILLNLVLSFQAAFTAPIILMASNRAEQKDRRKAEEAYFSIDKIENMLNRIQPNNTTTEVSLEKDKSTNGKSNGKK